MAANDLIVLRRGTATEWSSANPVLASGEPGYDLTNNTLKIGDGTKTWSQLSSLSAASGSSSSSISEYTTVSGFPTTGVSSTLYIATDSSRLYRWTGSVYVETGPVGGGDTSLWNLLLPSAPTGLTGSSGPSSVSLSWSAVNSTPSVTDYAIQYSSNSGTTWTSFSDGTSTSSLVSVTGLSNNIPYIFRVAAINGIGQGSWSNNSSSITPASDTYWSNVKLLLKMEGSNNSTSFSDSSSGNRTVTAQGGAIISTSQSKFGASAAYFDGSGDWLQAATTTDLDLSSNDFVFEMWLYPTSTSRQAIFHWSRGYDWSLALDFQNQRVCAWAGSSGSSWNLIESDSSAGHTSTSLSLNTWHHVAYVRSGTTFNVYINGTRELNLTGKSGSIAQSNTARAIGDWFTSSAMSQWTGYIDEFRVTIGSDRGFTGSTITVPTSSYPTG